MLGICAPTLARWEREEKISALFTPGGHRRYLLSEVRALLGVRAEPPDVRQMEEDAARLYLQGWTIVQIAEKFDRTYNQMRRILMKHVTMRDTRFGGRPPDKNEK